jgi:ornithine cyclodeaminase/alanine dehydrogenase-like protein (mu-crystallin family)
VANCDHPANARPVICFDNSTHDAGRVSLVSEKTYGFGLVGCGVIAPTHAEAIERLDNAELRGVCDLDEDAAQACATDFGAEPHTDLGEMLARRIEDGEIARARPERS